MNEKLLNLKTKLSSLEPIGDFLAEQYPESKKELDCVLPSCSYSSMANVCSRPSIMKYKDFMIYKLALALLKIQILKANYLYRSGMWIMRIKGTSLCYPEHCFVINVDLPCGNGKAEIIFLAESSEEKKAIESELKEVLAGKSLQELIYEFMAEKADTLSAIIDEDEDISTFKKQYGV